MDVDKSRIECRAYLDEEAKRIYGLSSEHLTAGSEGAVPRHGNVELTDDDHKGR